MSRRPLIDFAASRFEFDLLTVVVSIVPTNRAAVVDT